MVHNMQEYWVNVYPHGLGPIQFKKPFWTKDYYYGIVLYRIHVKMKEVKDKHDPSFKYLTDRISNETGKFN